MMFASAVFALAMLAQKRKDHAKPEPLSIIMSDGCIRPVSPSLSLLSACQGLMIQMEVYCNAQDARVLGMRCYRG